MIRLLPLFLLPLGACATGTSPLYSGDKPAPADTGVEDTGTPADTDTDSDTEADTDTDADSDTDTDEPVEYDDLDGDGQTGRIDCDDTDAAIYVGATETCNSVDDDCDGSIDEDEVCSTADLDGDGYTPAGGDCDDTDAAINPGAVDDSLDGIDQDCNDVPVETDTGSEPESPTDADSDGYTDAVDCDDTDASINPGATETCNSVDDDCDSAVDEGVTTTFYGDTDGDGYGDASESSSACAAPTGYVANDDDCNDADASINPGATETDNDVDDDCDGSIDEGITPATDSDGDGSSDSVDCNDVDASIYPDATETCNDGVDSNCDGVDGDVDRYVTYYQDDDGDGYGSTSSGPSAGFDTACSITAGYVANAQDCDDTDAAVNPAGNEYSAGIDGEDTDCDGDVDEVWQAKVEVTYPVSGSYTLNTALYSSGSVPNARSWSDESVTVNDNEAEVEYLTSEYGDVSGFCGLIVNGDGYNLDYLCYGGARDTSVTLELWFDGTWYDESDLDVWIANASNGECALILQVSSSSACTPVNDN